MTKALKRFLLLFLWAIASLGTRAQEQNPLRLPAVGDCELRILSPDTLELFVVTTKQPDPAPIGQWNFVDKSFKFVPPAKTNFSVRVGNQNSTFELLGFRRRVLYAPLKTRDLRIGNSLYFKLPHPIESGQTVELTNPNHFFLPTTKSITAKADPLRQSPLMHINQEGYLASFAKKAYLSYYLGSAGEFNTSGFTNFDIVEIKSGEGRYHGVLHLRQDRGYTYNPAPYQDVMEADFSDVKTPGNYRLKVAGLGTSLPFSITDDVAGNLTRTFALGLYHQRCGTDNALPYSRFTHGPCHTAPADVPTMKFQTVNAILADMTQHALTNPRHTARQLKSIDTSLYPFVRQNKIDVSGGHHDAGDYSKYTINSAQLIHMLVFAADAFPGAGELDNLGLPESGDGRSDLLQEAKWEADFLAKMQDDDGGFYFLVYPRERQYEHDVTPDFGDPQVVFPKTTSVTAAAVAALAQMGSSPLFKKQFPETAALYLTKAKKGWDFLERAIAKYGRDGAYQQITHYGNEFIHDDEIAWAATELFLATGDEKYHKELLDHFNPTSPETKRWNWWRLFESYGCAIRSYAFAAKTKRLPQSKLDDKFFRQCENEIIANAEEQVRNSNENAFGVSFPHESKRFRNAGWFFSTDTAFDLATACAMDYPILNDPRPKFLEALISNFDYELGDNPLNISFVAGLGWKRPREMVNQYAQNDPRALPPTGLPWGNIQEGFAYLDPYKKELGNLNFPTDWDEKNPYPFYERWGDSFNTTTECVTVNIGRALGAAAFLMAQTTLKNQPWKSAQGEILMGQSSDQNISAIFRSRGLDTTLVRCIWEAKNHEPEILTGTNRFRCQVTDNSWIEVEATWPDGRRVFASTNIVSSRKEIGAK